MRQEDRPADANAVAQAARIRQAAVERARQAELERERALVRAAEQHKRRRQLVVAGSAVAGALLLGLSGTSIGLWRAISAARAEHLAKLEAQRERDAKTQARDQAMAALRAMFDEVVEHQLARAPTLTEENKAFLRTIIHHFEGFAAITADDAESRAIRAEGYSRVGLMRYRLGELAEAESAFRDALPIGKPLAEEFPSRPEFRIGVAVALGSLAQLGTQRRDFAAAKAHMEEALAHYQAALKANPRDAQYAGQQIRPQSLISPSPAYRRRNPRAPSPANTRHR